MSSMVVDVSKDERLLLENTVFDLIFVPENNEFCKFLVSKSYKERIRILQKPLLDKGRTAFHGALAYSRQDLVLHFLSLIEGVDDLLSVLKVKDVKDCTVLHLAAREGATEVFEYIVDNFTLSLEPRRWFSLLQEFDEDGCTALHKAAASDKPVEAIGLMLQAVLSDQKVDSLKTTTRDDEDEATVLHVAVTTHAEADIIKGILGFIDDPSDIPKMLKVQALDGSTVLHSASKYLQSAGIISSLLEAVHPDDRFDMMNVQDCEGSTVLHHAVRRLDSQLIDSIQSYSLSDRWCELLAISDKNGYTPIQLLGKLPDRDVLESLVSHLTKETCFQLLQHPIMSDKNKTLLHCLTQCNDTDTTEYMLSLLLPLQRMNLLNSVTKGDVNGETMTPFKLAKKLGHYAVQEVLLKHREKAFMELSQQAGEGNDDPSSQPSKIQGLQYRIQELQALNQGLSDQLKDANRRYDEAVKASPGDTELHQRLRKEEKENKELKEKIERMADRISALEMLNKGLRKANNDRFDRITELEKLINDTLFDDTDKVEDVNITRDESCIEEGKKTEAADNELEVDASSRPLQSSSGGVTATTLDTEKVNSTLEDQEYYAIPLPLIRKLRRLCSELQIQDCRVHQNPHEWKNIVIYGTNANTKLLRHLDEFLKENPEFEKFEVKVHDRTEESQSNQLSFTFHSKTEDAKSATCELVVQEVKNHSLLFAVGPAHMLFCEEANESLKTEKCNIKKIRDHIKSGNPARKVKIHSGDVEIPVSTTPYISYRYKYKGAAQGHKLYTNDCALFQCIPSKVEQVKEGLTMAPWLNKELHVPETSLQTVHSTRQKVVIKTFRGMLHHDVDIEEDIENHEGIHLTFALTSKSGADGAYDKLELGDCGSILYYVDKKSDNTEILKPWGMLIASDPTPDFVLYHAIVLHQALADIVGDYPSLSSLRLYQPSVHGGAVANEVKAEAGGPGGPRPRGPRPGSQQAPVTPSLLSTNNISLA